MIPVLSDVEIHGSLNINENITVDGTLNVKSDMTLDGALNVSSNTTIDGELQIGSNTTLNGPIEVNSSAIIGGALTVNSNTTLNGVLNVDSNAIFNETITASSDIILDSNSRLIKKINNTGMTDIILGSRDDNDIAAIRVGAIGAEENHLEIATNGGSLEPVYVRQYLSDGGSLTAPINTLILLNGSGDTIIPNDLIVNNCQLGVVSLIYNDTKESPN